MVTKFGQFKKLKCPNFVNCPNFVTILCCILKMIFFFDIPSYPPPIAVQNTLTNQFFQKIEDSVYFQQKKLWQVLIGISILVIPDHMIIF